jgi:hypothetical protein
MSQFNQTDTMIKRDRLGRVLVAFGAPLLVMAVGYTFGAMLAGLFGIPQFIGIAAGIGAATFPAGWIFLRSLITNDAVAAFVTVDLLTDELVSYGPGFHFAFPWEKRSGANNVNLAEAAERYTLSVQAEKGGTLNLVWSVRLRPDINRLPEFLSGVASIASEIGGIISAEIIKYSKGMELRQLLNGLAELNNHLQQVFVHGRSGDDGSSPFEQRFGVMIGDVTVEEILPSKEVQETMSALTESAVIDDIVARSFGYDDTKLLREAVKTGDVTQDEVNRRRTQTMAMSGNLQGMDLKEHTFNLRVDGLNEISPEVAAALAAGLGIMRNANAGKNVGKQTRKGG